MKTISMMGLLRSLTIAAAATVFLAAPAQRAQAMSLITPGASPAKAATDGLIQVRGGMGGHGGGGGFHGGGFHGGGFHGGGFHGGGFHGGGFRGGGFHAFHGGGFRGGGFRAGGFHHFGGPRFAHFHRRHFFYGGYYPYYYYPRHCRVIWTYHGPRRVCGWRHWHRWHRYY
jgi:hypothetical protein